ncbi:PREDICTED: trypsin-1-like [Ceratosolen solmsi marchali]|uniref:Trypsin-1-like n=1 Tax=Ceratosolen solmsi marchali TaxID=326594 RepID=A0AAJ7E024_9HYME|nr:PREDICTED: trypsin-1-like [Ceratosolen solmsi marchali]
MKFLCLLLLIICINIYFVVGLDNLDDFEFYHRKNRIVGGINASINSLPYQAQLLQNGHLICGGTIISKLWIVTAAHCIYKSKPVWSIIVGSADVSTGGEHHKISNIIVHPKYDNQTEDNDIALIKLAKLIVFNRHKKSVPLAIVPPKTGDLMIISGFGKLGEYKGYPLILEKATVIVSDHAACKIKYQGDPITDNMFCAGAGVTDACQGDSGGPGIINGYLAGVVSSGMECASIYYPGIYTKVFNYHKWIIKTMRTRKSGFQEILRHSFFGKLIEHLFTKI